MARTAAKLTVVEQPGIGHNSIPTETMKLLGNIVERVERLGGERELINDGIKEIFMEAKSHGFDTAALRELITYRKRLAKDAAKVEQREEAKDLYKHALGM